MTDKLILISVPSRGKSRVREMLLTLARGSKGAMFAKAWNNTKPDPPPQHWLRVQPASPPITYSPDVWRISHWPVEKRHPEEFKTWGPADRIPLREAMTAVKRAIEAGDYFI